MTAFEPFLFKEFTIQLNTTFSDICCSDFCKDRTGFSGTPYFESPYDRESIKNISINPIESDYGEGGIFYSILDERVNIFEFQSI